MQAQAAMSFASPFLPLLTPSTKSLSAPMKSIPTLKTPHCPPIKATFVADDASTVDYSSSTSVFPAEACDTIGGDACDDKIYPEVKLKPKHKSNTPSTTPETVDREYLEYNSPKTVFLEEACDDLGGEFCEPEHQKEPN